jgi:peptide/nickel transport system permease protein
MIPTLLGIMFITFIMLKLAPGDPVSLKLMFAGDGLSPEALNAELSKQEEPFELPEWYLSMKSSLSESFHGQEEGTKTDEALTWVGKNTIYFGKWVYNIAKLDFGYSSKDKKPVLTKIKEALPITLTLNIISILIVYFISVPLGIWSALNKEKLIDKVVMVKLFLLYALPSFWVATLLQVYLAGGDYLNLFPLIGYESDYADSLGFFDWLLNVAWHLVLPITVSVYGGFTFLSRFCRTNFLEVIKQDYIRTARAKGLSSKKVIWKHAFRNSLIPLVTLMGTLLPALLGGSVIIEKIFSLPGMGLLAFEAVLSRDQNLIMGISVISAFLTLISLLITDFLYTFVDPRVSFDSKT